MMKKIFQRWVLSNTYLFIVDLNAVFFFIFNYPWYMYNKKTMRPNDEDKHIPGPMRAPSAFGIVHLSRPPFR